MLTAKAIEAAKPGEKPCKPSGGIRLYLEVMPNGSRYWRMKYRFAGKEKRLAFGVYPTVALAEAREQRGPGEENPGCVCQVVQKGNRPLADPGKRVEFQNADVSLRRAGRSARRQFMVPFTRYGLEAHATSPRCE